MGEWKRIIPYFSPPPSPVTALAARKRGSGPRGAAGGGARPPPRCAPAPRLPVILGRAGSGAVRSLCIDTGAGENWGQTGKAGEQGRGWGHTDAQPSAAEPRGRGQTRRERRTGHPGPHSRGALLAAAPTEPLPHEACGERDQDALGGVSFAVFPGPALPGRVAFGWPSVAMAQRLGWQSLPRVLPSTPLSRGLQPQGDQEVSLAGCPQSPCMSLETLGILAEFQMSVSPGSACKVAASDLSLTHKSPPKPPGRQYWGREDPPGHGKAQGPRRRLFCHGEGVGSPRGRTQTDRHPRTAAKRPKGDSISRRSLDFYAETETCCHMHVSRPPGFVTRDPVSMTCIWLGGCLCGRVTRVVEELGGTREAERRSLKPRRGWGTPSLAVARQVTHLRDLGRGPHVGSLLPRAQPRTGEQGSSLARQGPLHAAGIVWGGSPFQGYPVSTQPGLLRGGLTHVSRWGCPLSQGCGSPVR